MNSSSLLATQYAATEPTFNLQQTLLQSVIMGLVIALVIGFASRMQPVERPYARSMMHSFKESFKRSRALSMRKSTAAALFDAMLDFISYVGTWLAATIFAFLGLMVSIIYSLHVVPAFGIIIAIIAMIAGTIYVVGRFEDWRLDRRELAEASL